MELAFSSFIFLNSYDSYTIALIDEPSTLKELTLQLKMFNHCVAAYGAQEVSLVCAQNSQMLL